MKKTPTKILSSIQKHNGKATVYNICADTELTYAYISWNLRVLEAQGIISKHPNPNDIRQFFWAVKQGGNPI